MKEIIVGRKKRSFKLTKSKRKYSESEDCAIPKNLIKQHWYEKENETIRNHRKKVA